MAGRSSSIPQLRFDSPRLAKVGVEALTLQELRRRAPDARLSAPQRVDFHHMLLVSAGRCRHRIDFVEHELRPGSVLLVRAGQVQQWRLREGVQGELALVSAQALGSGADTELLALDGWPAVARPSAPLFAQALAGMARLRADTERFAGTAVEAGIIRHELLTVLLRLARELRARERGRAASNEAMIHGLFAAQLEAGFATRMSVLDYARRLGYSESTLSRACVAAVGHTAKEAIDARVALEAKRLLAHGEATVVAIGHQLGFSEPTNFVKFFRRNVGCTPLEFRRAHRA